MRNLCLPPYRHARSGPDSQVRVKEFGRAVFGQRFVMGGHAEVQFCS